MPATMSTNRDLANVLWAAVQEMRLYADSQAFEPEQLGKRIVAVAAEVDALRKDLEARSR
jgi:hypothetical protein